MNDPRQTNTERRIRLERQIARLRALDNRYSAVRAFIFVGGAVASLVLSGTDSRAAWAVALFALLLFAVSVALHRRVRVLLAQFRLWGALKDEHEARAALEWAKLRPALRPLAEREHPFEADLDLTGDRSLHHLLDTPVSLEGSLRLRDRLTQTPPDVATVAARQALVRELVPLTHFRDRLTLSARGVIGAAPRWEARRLLTWIAGGVPQGHLRLTLTVAALLALSNVVLFLLNGAGWLPPLWIATFVAYAAVTLWQMRGEESLFERAAALEDALAVLVAVSRRLETRSFAGQPHLSDLLKPFRSANKPSARLRQAARLAVAASVQKNFMLSILLNTLLPWDIFIAYRLERYRRQLAADLPAWLDVWFELETACALATFADLHPAYAFPQVAANFVFSTQQLGHPLIAAGTRVCNDFAVERLGEVVLITGSNMSGKSSFLRTVGANLCLAYAGAPACADALDVGLFRLFTSIQVSDSLADGFSYFYAEVRRLRALLTALEADDPLPLFFLIDEIFRGTNNQERLIGSRAYVRALGGKHGLGLISTHDLELTALPGLLNYHFEDQVVDRQMHFDYRLRPGRSPTTNALKIMRLAGLPVDE